MAYSWLHEEAELRKYIRLNACCGIDRPLQTFGRYFCCQCPGEFPVHVFVCLDAAGNGFFHHAAAGYIDIDITGIQDIERNVQRNAEVVEGLAA